MKSKSMKLKRLNSLKCTWLDFDLQERLEKVEDEKGKEKVADVDKDGLPRKVEEEE